MKNKEQNIWIGDKDLTRDPGFLNDSQEEFKDAEGLVGALARKEVWNEMPGANRRDFLKMLGFGLGAATLAAGCEIPLKRAIPYTVKPDEIVPGVANYYASSFVNGSDYCAVLVKTREGRPIKIEGNHMSAVTHGGTSARSQALVLSLYDTKRVKGPMKKDGDKWAEMSWADLDAEVASKLNANSRVAILSGTIMSPSSKAVIGAFRNKYPNTRHVSFDGVSAAAILKANEECYGQKVVPNYRFGKADVIVSFNADFLGTWISPVEYAHEYIQNRKIKDVKDAKMSRHYQVESYMSMTGSNADNRVVVKPSEISASIAALYNNVAAQTGGARIDGPQLSNEKASNAISAIARDLLSNRGNSLVVSGSNNLGDQVLIARINDLLGNVGSTVDFTEASMQKQGDETELQQLIADMDAGRIDTVIVWDANPAYQTPFAESFRNAFAKVGTRISFGGVLDETTLLCTHLAPNHHLLESWGDVEPKRGHISMIQPTISPLFDTRQAEHSLLLWAGSNQLDQNAEQPYYEYIRARWQREMMGMQSRFADFRSMWDSLLHDGTFTYQPEEVNVTFNGNIRAAAQKLTSPGSGGMEINFVEEVAMGDGRYADNPWLQEMPDPVTRCTWGNYLAVPLEWDGVRQFNGLNDLEDGDLAELAAGEQTVTVPVIKQFGQPKDVLTLAVGYGRTAAGRTGSHVGVDVNPMLTTDNDGLIQYHATGVSVSGKVGEEDHFSCVQYHHTMGVKGVDKKTNEIINADEAATVAMGYGLVDQGFQGSLTDRSIIRGANLGDLESFIHDLEEERHHHQHLNEQQIYSGHDELYQRGHHWGMHVDLNACIGCGACTVACMSENNVPVVGKREVSRHHEMTWLRIDRYFYGDVENPKAVYQPMMCQHCDNAPCENVCPVNATNHSSEGLNQMAYNRCVGTRYCANNCPYKVRRFNWLDFMSADLWPVNEPNLGNKVREDDTPWMADNLTRMVLNPDVTVRSRGVIEKCSFCAQRIQEGKLRAKVDNRKLRDADVKTACQTACPTGAITFGDMNSDGDLLSKKLESPLNYIVLEETNTRSSVNYQARIVNPNENIEAI